MLKRARAAWLGLVIAVAIGRAWAHADDAGAPPPAPIAVVDAGGSAAPAIVVDAGVRTGAPMAATGSDAGASASVVAADAHLAIAPGDAAIVVRAPIDAGVITADAHASVDAAIAHAAITDAGAITTAIANDAGALVPAAATDAGTANDAGIATATATAPTPPTVTPGTLLGATPGAAPPSTAAPAHGDDSTSANTLFAIKIIGGLVALLVLAYLGGHRRVVRFQERLGLSGVITAGFPFVALGLIASLPSVGILTGDVLARLRPLLHFGLGWLGFIIGAQLDIRVLDRVPKGTAYIILVEALGPFAITAAACGGVMVLFGLSLTEPAVWRDVILLGTAAAMTAPRKFRGFANRTWHEGRSVDILLAQLDELVGVIGLLFITAYFRDPSASAWHLPNTAWIFISLGLGVAIGVLIFAMIRVPQSDAEFLAVVLGGIAFASGLAGYLHLSPIVICFLAGVLVTNFPNDQRDSVFRILNHLERPVHLLFLIIAGAVWNVGDWRGWVLVPLFVAGRVLGKWAGIFAARASVGADLPTGYADQRTLISPLSSLSIALVISIDSMFGDRGLTWIVTAVIGGAIVSELLTQYKPTQIDAAPAAPIDELDSAPIDELDEGTSAPVATPAGGTPTPAAPLRIADGETGPIYRAETEPPLPPKPSTTKPPTGGRA